jgi:hypothetical protein
MKHIQKYRELIDNSLFEEAYMLLESEVKYLEEQNKLIERNRLIRDFFVGVFEDEYFNQFIDRGVLLPIAQETIKALFSKEFLKEQIKKFPNYLDEDKISIMFVLLVQNHDFSEAINLLPWVNKNIKNYPSTINKIIEEKNIKALEFLIRNMENIHFNEGELLRKCCDMPTDILRIMIDDLKFDINEQSKNEGINLIHTLLIKKNIKNFSFIVQNYGNKIDWSAKCLFKDRKQQFFRFDVLELIKATNSYAEFYNIILDDFSLKESIVDRIGSVLLTKRKAIEQCINTSIYEKLFSHPNFNPKITNLKQNHLIYGLLSEIGKSSFIKDYDLTKHYYNILNTFLNTYLFHDDNIEDTPQYNVVGAAISVVEKIESHFKEYEKNLSKANLTLDKEKHLSNIKVVLDAATLIVRRYKHYVNKPNPDGRLSIELTVKDSSAYRLLVNNGALTVEQEPGILNALYRMLGVRKRELDKQREMIIKKGKEVSSQVFEENSGNNSFISLKNQMREDFRIMRSYINHKFCDPSIKFKCENMFLKSERLVTLMEKYNITKSFEDMIFLSKNFSEYLKETLKAYIEVCEATNDFSDTNMKYEKLELVKKKCLSQVDLLYEQVELINQNISAEAEGNALRNLNIQGRFLKNKFDGNRNDLELDDIISKNIEKDEKEKMVQEQIRNEKIEENQVQEKNIDIEEDSKVVNVVNSIRKKM